MTIIATHAIEDLESKDTPAPRHRTAQSGYGRKIPTTKMVKLPGSNRWRRVYCCIFSNAGTCYVAKGNDWVVIR